MLTPGRDPIYGPRVKIWTNLNLHVLRMLYTKYWSSRSCTCSSQEEDVGIHTLYNYKHMLNFELWMW